MLDNLIGTVTARSLEAYRDSYGRYVAFCEGKQMEPKSAMSLLAWRTSLVEVGYSPNTINSHLSAVKSIFKAAVPTGEISLELYSQARAVATVSVRALRDRLRPDKDLLTETTMQELLDSLTGDDLLTLRDKALLALFVTSGARVSELVNITVSDLNLDNSSFYVTGKTDKRPREVPSSRAAMAYVLKWLYARGNTPSGFVFSSFQGKSLQVTDKPMTRQAAHDVVTKRAAAVGLDLACHDFRRFVATKLAEGNIRQAQEALGHASIQTTQRYVKRAALPNVDWLK